MRQTLERLILVNTQIHKACIPPYRSMNVYGGLNRYVVVNLANALFSCAHGDWVVQPLGHAVLSVVRPPSLLNPHLSSVIFLFLF